MSYMYVVHSYFDMCLLSPLPWLLPLTSPFTLTLSPSPLVLSADFPSFRAGPGPSPPSGMTPSIVGEGALSFAVGGTSSGEGDFCRINWRRLRVGVQEYGFIREHKYYLVRTTRYMIYPVYLNNTYPKKILL